VPGCANITSNLGIHPPPLLSAGALVALAVGSVRVSWAAWGELALCVFSGVMAACVFTMDLARDIRLCYASYVLFRSAYTLLITIATSVRPASCRVAN